MCEEIDVIEAGELVYLYLPLAHSYALLIQLLAVDLGAPLIYWSGDPQQIVPDLMATKPVYLPSVPRIFEKIYTLVTSNNDPEKIKAATQLGLTVRRMREAGQEVPAPLAAAFEKADAELFANVRGIFGGNLKQATSGAAPISMEILEFFYACGAPVLEGYGMTETSTVSTTSTVADHRLGTVGRAIPGCEIKIAGDGEILVRGPHIFRGYYGAGDDTTAFGGVTEDGWLHTGDLGSLDDDGYLTITGRKKDIMITAGGKNLTPANLENDLKNSRWISQAVMHADRRPYPVALITLDPEEIVHFAREHGLPEDARRAGGRAEGGRADPGRARPGERQLRPRGADQALLHPRPRPLAGDRRADADAEGQAQRRQRALRGALREPVLLSGAFDRPVERAARLLAGLVLFGLALAVLVEADLGLDPWTVFHQGISRHVDLSLGTITVISSLIVLVLWIPLGERPGLGTIANALIVGPVLDLGVATIPAPARLGAAPGVRRRRDPRHRRGHRALRGRRLGPRPARRPDDRHGQARRPGRPGARLGRADDARSSAGCSAAPSASPPSCSRPSIGPLVKPALAHLAIRPWRPREQAQASLWRSSAPVVCSRMRRQARVFSRSAEKWRTTLRTRVAEISMPWRRQTSRISS